MPLSVETAGRLDNWKELLLDLFYVIFIIKLGNIFLSCQLDGTGYLFAVSHFLGIYMAKFELDQYLNKFGQKDFLHNAFLILYSFGLFISILNVNDTAEWSNRQNNGTSSCFGYRFYEYGYYSGWLITRGAFLIMYSLIGYFIKPQGIYSFVTKAPIFVASIILISVNFIWSKDFDHHRRHSYLVLAAALVEYFGFACWQIGIVGTYIKKCVGTRAYIPVNINHQSARTSSFILSVFGATFYQIMTAPLTPSVEYYVIVCLSFALVLTLALLYFDVIPPKNSTHALGISRIAGMTWLMLHPIYGFCLYMIGVIFQLVLSDVDNDMSNSHANHRFTLGIFVSAATLCVLLIRGTHKVLWSSGGKVTSFLRLLIVIAHIIVAVHSLHQESQSLGAVIGTHLTLSIGYLAIDLFKYRRMDPFLLKSYDTLGEQSHQPLPSTASKINSDATIAYVPVERRENWVNILGDIRNYKGKQRRPSHKAIQMKDGVPVIVVEKRNPPHAIEEINGNDNVGPRAQTAKVIISQRRGSADARTIKAMKVANDDDEKNKITLSRGKSAGDLRNIPGQDNAITFQRTLTQAQLSGIIASGKDRKRGNYIEDENGKIRERIIIRRKRSAPNKESLTLASKSSPEHRSPGREKKNLMDSTKSPQNNSTSSPTTKDKDSSLQTLPEVEREEEDVINIARVK